MDNKIRILPVDDNPAILQIMSDFFSDKPDIELVGCAYDGEQALTMIRETRPDVLLLDAIMPRLDGFSVLEELRNLPDAPHVIMVTALSRDDLVMRAMQLGASYYMVKPIDLNVLHERIKQVNESMHTQIMPADARNTLQYSADEQITNLFLSIGIPAHIKGYQYLRQAVHMVMDDHDILSRITKELYPGIAHRFSTTASKVERAMRHAIEVAWNRGRLDSVNRMYGYNVFSADDKPTNGEFVAMIADKVGMQKSA